MRLFFPRRHWARILLIAVAVLGTVAAALVLIPTFFPPCAKGRTVGVLAVRPFGTSPSGSGQGLLLDSLHVMTCYHVAEGAASLTVITDLGSPVDVVGVTDSDPILDYAVLELARRVRFDRNSELQTGHATPGTPAVVRLVIPGVDESAVCNIVSLLSFPGRGEMLELDTMFEAGWSGSPVFVGETAVGIVATGYDGSSYALPLPRIQTGRTVRMARWQHESGIAMDHRRRLRRIADMHYSRNELTEALEVYETAIRRDAADWDADMGIAACLEFLDRTDEAIEVRRRILAAFPGDPRSAFHVARLLIKVGKNAEAASVLADLTDRIPAHRYELLVDTAELEVSLENPAAARALLDRALKKKSDGTRALRLRESLNAELAPH